MRSWLAENGLAEAPPTRETAVRVSQLMRSQFNCDKSSWKAYSTSGRPFLRHDAEWLLEHREGLCGEGARLLVVALQELGIDAVRVVLYDRYLRTHALVSVVIEGEESFVDSIYTREEMNVFLNTYAIGPARFPIVHYDANLARRAAAGKVVDDTASDLPQPSIDGVLFFDKYLFYAYDGVPYTKLLAVAGLDVRVFNLQRPSARVGAIAEKPHTVLAIAWGVVGGSLAGLVLFVGRARREPRVVPEVTRRVA